MKIYLIRTGKCLPVLMGIVAIVVLNIGIASNALGGIQVYHTSATVGNEINSSGSYDFGSHLVGETVIKTFVIKNPSGELMVNPDGFSSPYLPSGFSFPATETFDTNKDISVEEGSTISFQVQLETSSAGNFSGNNLTFCYYIPPLSFLTYTFELRGTVTSAADTAAPTVSSTTPTSDETGVAVDANITITFSEEVNVVSGWFTISGSSSGAHSAAVTGGTLSYTLDPTMNFTGGETVTVTIDKDKVNDTDTDDATYDYMTANDSWTFTIVDAAPSVFGKAPANLETNVPLNSNITVDFSESVNVTGSWYSISGARSGGHTATVSGISPNYTLNPDSDFWYNETVTVTINSAQVSDTDTADPPDTMTADDNWTFTTACSNAITVTATGDSGAGTLREAVAGICSGGTISFASSLANQTITLTTGELAIDKNLTVTNADAPGLVISGGGNSRVFNINSGKTVTITNLTISNGRTTIEGGGIYNAGTLTLNNCTLNSNQITGASTGGGAIFNVNTGSLTLTNSTLSGNATGAGSDGGGIFNAAGGTITVNNCTITNNTANNGGGIANAGGTANIKHSIIAGNTAPTNPDVGGTFTSNGYNLIGIDGAGNFTATGDQKGAAGSPLDPKLSALAANGGPTKTHALQTGSPAIDAGDPSFSGLSTDQRGTGYARVVGGRIDIGAFEAPPAVVVSISGASAVEGGAMTFTVSRSPSGGAISVNYTTANGSALAGSDYYGASGTLSLADGVSSGTVTVSTVDDGLDEDTEDFTVMLSGPVNATIGTGTASGTISDNDSAVLSINDITVTEGNAGTVSAAFTVSLSLPSTKTVTVNYQTANSTAIAGTDYESAGGALSFDPGQTAKTFSVAVKGDITDEDNETFFVNLSSPSNASIADSQGIGTITDDDGAPMLSIVDATVNEGNAGIVNAAFTVNLAPASSKTVTVTYQTADNTAIAGNDYTAAGPATLTFSPGETVKTVNIAVLGDDTDEDDETFYVNLSAPVNAAIADAQAVGTIKSDDAPPSLSINDVSVSEGNEGTVNATFTVTLSTASSRTVTAEYLTVNNTAIGGSDYVSVAPTKLTFAPGETSQPLDIAVIGDVTEENDETFFVNLINPSNASIADNQGLGTIKNDDGASSLSVNDVTVTESNAGTVSAMFTVTLSAPSSKIITVNCNNSDSTATAGKDYTAVNTTLTFNPGETLKTVNVFVLADTLYEKNETFSVNLSDESNAGIADHQGIGTIKDDDAPPAISVKDAVADEGVVSMTFVVTLSEKSELEASADYVVSSSSIARSNLEPLSGKVSIPAGSLSAVITIDLLASGINGVFNVDLNNPVNATLRDNRGVGLISGGEVIPGDVNDSGYVDLEDIIIALQLLVGMNENTAYAAADMNGDGRIGMEDIIFILQMLADMR